ncbi:MAG: helix-turn-helix domain-containing protein [Gammaproteobacteria bacterium]|nr:helix-turn-helix domain-containing protein [Gammaproteobacteria bacterium]
MSKLYTTDEAATFLGVSASRVRQLILEKRLKSQKIGRDHIITEIDLLEFKDIGPLKRGRPKI